MEFLPNELLRAIFCEVTAAPKSTLNTNRIYEFEAPWSLTRAPYELAAVSRLWRGICMSTPELWTYIQLIGDDQHRNIDLLRQNLDRSGSRPLDVCFSLGFIDHDDWRTTVEIVLEHAHRWRRLKFSMAEGATDAIIPDIIKLCTSRPTPILEELTMAGGELDYRLADSQYDAQNPYRLLEGSKLRRFTTHSFCIVPATTLGTLQYLSISLRSVDERPLWDTLAMTPALEHLDVYFPTIVDGRGVSPEQDIYLPFLTHLGVFGFPIDDAPWADKLHLPSLTTLTVSLESCDHLNRILNAVRSCRLHVIITSVETYSMPTLCDRDLEALAILQEVETLELVNLQPHMLNSHAPSFFESMARRARDTPWHWVSRFPQLVIRDCTFRLEDCQELADYAQMRAIPARTRRATITQPLSLQWINSELRSDGQPKWFKRRQRFFEGATMVHGH